MDAMSWVDVISRWAHVVAGVLWIGLLYYFNWINGSVAAKLDADTKQKVLPELLPRTLYFFRWGAAYTWVTGVLLLGVVYYRDGLTRARRSALCVGGGIVVVCRLLQWGRGSETASESASETESAFRGYSPGT